MTTTKTLRSVFSWRTSSRNALGQDGGKEGGQTTKTRANIKGYQQRWSSSVQVVTLSHLHLTQPIHSLILDLMKTPQRWRTSRIYVIVSFAILTLFDVVTSFCDVNWRHDVIPIRMLNGSVVRAQTHTHTDKRFWFYALDRWRGR